MMGPHCALPALLVLTVITVVRGQTQYYDNLQTPQQSVQPYHDFKINQYNVAIRAHHDTETNRQENNKTIEQRHHNQKTRARKSAPANQYDYVFATTEKPSLSVTNRTMPANNTIVFNKPSDPSSVTFTGITDLDPEILIGPNEDDMTELQRRQFEDKAERMCEYYKSLTVRKVLVLPLIPSGATELNVSDCPPMGIPLILGGEDTSIRDFPHMAVVGWRKVQQAGFSWKCGGSLISDRYVLTTGHCTYQDRDDSVLSGPPQAVQLGSSYLNDPDAQVVKISAVIRHPKYKRRRSYHDVALIKMASKVKFSEVIRPACLGVPPPEGTRIIATGWGRTEYGGGHSLELRRVSLPVWNIQECKDVWGTSLKLPNGVTPDSHMCAGERSGGRGTCQGDSGGPAQIRDGCLWRVVAVTSYGRSCGAPDIPTLFAVIPHVFVAAQVFSDVS